MTGSLFDQEFDNGEMKVLLQAVKALTVAIDAKDSYTRGHSNRVANLSSLIARRLGLSTDECFQIYCAGMLHDVGKIRIPESILNKPGRLTNEEFEFIKLHTVVGYHILKDISWGHMIADAAKYHHEHYDGSGYPNGLSGENIPMIARIVAAADSYDAMTSKRSYRMDPLARERVIHEIKSNLGTQFDPESGQIMLQLIEEDTEYKLLPETKRYNILVVDDEEVNSRILKHILSQSVLYDVQSVSSGEAAVARAMEEKFDLIMMDIYMPGMDGLDTMKMIREFDRDVQVIFTTSERDILTMHEISSLKASDYITKPYSVTIVNEVVRTALSN